MLTLVRLSGVAGCGSGYPGFNGIADRRVRRQTRRGGTIELRDLPPSHDEIIQLISASCGTERVIGIFEIFKL